MNNISKLGNCLLLIVVCISYFSFSVIDGNTEKKIVLQYPNYWPKPTINFKKLKLTEEKVSLGRYLFYDGILSKDSLTPCASCHQQQVAFANQDHDLSHGYNNQFTKRNAPALQNLAWQPYFMQDGSIRTLLSQPFHPLTATNEMAETIDGIEYKLNRSNFYKQKFKQAFASKKITIHMVNEALTQFMVTLISCQSKYDDVIAGKQTFNLPEQLGYQVFNQKCSSCHKPPFFTDFSFKNIGIPKDVRLNDVGRMEVTKLASDSLKFRVPSLRNVEWTKPYGHDGRFFDTYNVLHHYRSSVQQSATTDALLAKGIPLSDYEIGVLTAFLNTLSDSTFIHNSAFSNPFTGQLIQTHQHK